MEIKLKKNPETKTAKDEKPVEVKKEKKEPAPLPEENLHTVTGGFGPTLPANGIDDDLREKA